MNVPPVQWIEDTYLPRMDSFSRPVWWWSRSIRVDHPEWFRVGDLVRIGRDRLSGDTAYPFALNEAVLVSGVRGRRLRVKRAVGSRRRQLALHGVLVIVGNVSGPAKIKIARMAS